MFNVSGVYFTIATLPCYISFLYSNQNFKAKDSYFNETFFKIERQIRLFHIKNNLLYNNNGDELEEHSLWITDRIGNLRETKILKKMSSVSNVYEIRINAEYIKYRILLFPLDTGGKIVLSFYFEKTEGEKDMTQELTDETQRIFGECLTGNESYYVGGA